MTQESVFCSNRWLFLCYLYILWENDVKPWEKRGVHIGRGESVCFQKDTERGFGELRI